MIMEDFDFDYWRQLAETDPSAYFKAREETIRHFISSVPEHEKMLTELQFQIDGIRLMAASPVQACQRLFGLMEDNLHMLGSSLGELGKEAQSLGGLLERIQPAT
jgi:hypothetical protein